MSQQNLGDSPLSSTYQKTEPFLLIHIALLAAVPLVMVLCMMGLAVGDPVLPGWLEMIVLGLPPIALTIWIQWQKPLYPFSLWVLAKPATELSDSQRRVLSVLRRRINGWYTGAWVAVVAGVFLYVVFRQIYLSAPLAADIAPFPPVLRLIGILWAEVFFLIGNLLLQMGAAAARVMFLPPSEFNSLKPYESDRIRKDFTIVGMRSPHLLDFASDSLEPIQQTAELITDQPESAQLPASGTKQTIADKIKPLFAQLSGVSDTLSALLNKVSTLLPSKSPSQSTEPKTPPAKPIPTPPVVSDEVSSPSIETVETVKTIETELTAKFADAVEAKIENAESLETEVEEETIETPPAVPENEKSGTVEADISPPVEEIATEETTEEITEEIAEDIYEIQEREAIAEEQASEPEEVSDEVQESTSDTTNDLLQPAPESISESTSATTTSQDGGTPPLEDRSNDDAWS